MTTETKSWSETDPCLALDEALSDPGLTPARRNELIHAVISLCLVSPAPFRRLWGYGKHSLLTGELALRAYQASLSHPHGAAFRVWFDSVPTLRVQPKTVSTTLLTRSQQAAWNALEETADLYFGGTLRKSRIQPRTSRLIAGPSGVGKTHLVRTFAREQGCGFLSLSYGAWLPSGSKGDENTAQLVMLFVAAHERCIIAIDELDKFHRGLNHEWSVSIQNDLFALLDRTWFQGSTEIKQRIQQRLRENVFIVGLGTWQSLWSVAGGATRTIGFRQSGNAAMAEQIRAAAVIPTELLNRFNSDILLLEPMTAADFSDICQAEGLEAEGAKLSIVLDYAEAEASGLGMRWVEALVLKIHATRARLLRADSASTRASSTNLPANNLERI
jgi:hypothetical protein